MGGGKVRIGVHIADVSAYVKPGSPLDVEAQTRGNSTYLVGTVIPMLPHALSNGLCSLVEAEDRLTKSCFITFSPKAEILDVEFANTIIRSDKRLTYAQAHAFMVEEDFEKIRETPLPPKHQTGSTGRPLGEVSDAEMQTLKTLIGELWKIAAQLRKKRFRKGSLDLEMTEVKLYVDEDGYADRIEKQSHDESHQLIEEFMLAANEQVARAMKRENFPSLYRVHDEPEEEKLNELRETMLTFGVPCGNLNKPREMTALLKKLKEHPQGYTLKVHVLRSLKQAQYRASADGHYGLAKPDYTHFTSPIRRYADLVVHRVIDTYLHKHKADSAPAEPDVRYSQSKLASLGDHLCVTERNSVDAERESVKTKLLEFYERQLAKDEKQHFKAVITDVKNHGLFIELTDSLAFGMIHISDPRRRLLPPEQRGHRPHRPPQKADLRPRPAHHGHRRARRPLQAPDRLPRRPRRGRKNAKPRRKPFSKSKGNRKRPARTEKAKKVPKKKGEVLTERPKKKRRRNR